MTDLDLNDYRNLLISDEDYYLENKVAIDYQIKNLRKLLDPAKRLTEEQFCEMVDKGANYRFYFYCFICNTCSQVEDLQKEHISGITYMYKNLDDMEVDLIGQVIKFYYTMPFDVYEAGYHYSIWSWLLDLYIRLHKIGRFEEWYDQVKGTVEYGQICQEIIKKEIQEFNNELDQKIQDDLKKQTEKVQEIVEVTEEEEKSRCNIV